jgi:hypothetical protein
MKYKQGPETSLHYSLAALCNYLGMLRCTVIMPTRDQDARWFLVDDLTSADPLVAIHANILTTPNGSGYMDSGGFTLWFRDSFLEETDKIRCGRKSVLILDGCCAHINLDAARLARDHNVNLYVMPPGTTSVLQPLDVGVFNILHQCWNSKLKDWRDAHPGHALRHRDVVRLMAAALHDLAPSHCASAFRRCGIVPWDPEGTKDKILATNRGYLLTPQWAAEAAPVNGSDFKAAVLKILQQKINQQHTDARAPRANASKRMALRAEGRPLLLTSAEVIQRLQQARADKEHSRQEAQARAAQRTRHQADRDAKQAAWDAMSPEERAARTQEKRRLQVEKAKATRKRNKRRALDAGSGAGSAALPPTNNIAIAAANAVAIQSDTEDDQ